MSTNQKTVEEFKQLLDLISIQSETLNKWRSFALLLWNDMELCNKEELCKNIPNRPMCPCDYYKELVLNEQHEN